MKKTGYLILCFVLGFSVISCDEDDPEKVNSTFKVTIQNVFEGKNYFISGTTDAIGPGESYSFSFHAGKGHYLSFASMLVIPSTSLPVNSVLPVSVFTSPSALALNEG